MQKLIVSAILCAFLAMPAFAATKYVRKTGNDITTSSSAFNTGVAISGVTIDYDNVTRPKCTTYDRGAFEYNGTCP